jgi:Fe-S-cluster-containing dehydrogenase component/Ni/Fe-hydrogenase subunit HybB-like protein
VRYGFVIDQRACIGCHACTVACKEEHEVPLGVFRTWVKYVERGAYPETRRFFSVLRCNHCDNAPCVTICPTVALYRRPDGIVDFDSTRCIGCKSCLQACPYDALYIDPSTQTAAKCNYCAHRVEVGLEPACVTVCPERAIIAGDLDDPGSRIARHVARDPVQVRKPELGTEPKVFYLGADAAALAPSLQEPAGAYMWSEGGRGKGNGKGNGNGYGEHGWRGGLTAPGLARPVYDVPHMALPWGWKVSAYLWTKSIAAGVLLFEALAMYWPVNLSGVPVTPMRIWSPLIALLFLGATTALLVSDLKRPDRFLYILFKPNRRSWLVWGAWILIGYGALALLWLIGSAKEDVFLLWRLTPFVLLFAAGTAGYSAFLFRQAEGRVFWRSPLLLPQLVASALLAGSATLIQVEWVWWRFADHVRWESGEIPGYMLFVALGFLASLLVNGILLGAEYSGGHAGRDGAVAAHLVTRGSWRVAFWGGVVLGGLIAPIALTVLAWITQEASLWMLAALLALTGLFVYEWIWVKAGQAVPLS